MPLAEGSHKDVTAYRRRRGQAPRHARQWHATSGLREPGQFRAYRGEAAAPSAILLRNHGLHLEIVIDRTHPIGRNDRAGVADVVLEAAVTTIMDLEDSVAAVDAADKVALYRNWLGLMKGTIATSFEKEGRRRERRLAPDRLYTQPDGTSLALPGPQPDAGAQCRPSHDERCRAGWRRADARNLARCLYDGPHRAA